MTSPRYSADTDFQGLNQSLDTLSATLDQIAPQLGPAFDGLTRLSKSLNARNENLRDLLKSATDVTGILSERSQQINTLILDANDLLAVLSARRNAIVSLLANTSAVAQQLTGLVHDNEAKLAPALERLNRVNQMLEKNRDNIGKALTGLKKFQITQGEAVASGYYYDAFIPNLGLPQLLQPFIDYIFGFRRGVERRAAAGQRRAAGRIAVPVQRDPATERNVGAGSAEWESAMMTRKRLATGVTIVLIGLVVAAAIFVVRQTFFKPQTITAYFTTATAIYSGDDVRVSGVKVGSIARIDAVGTQAKVTMHVDRDIPIPADAKAVIVAQNLVAARYVATHTGVPDQRPEDGRRGRDTRRSHRGARRVGRGQRPIDAAVNRIGSQQPGVHAVDRPVHRQRCERAERQR